VEDNLLSIQPLPNNRLPRSIFLGLIVIGAVQAHYYAQRMPEVIASHFGNAGMANGWQSKSAFFITELGLIIAASVVTFGAPLITALLPASAINLPNKEFWLAPDRREYILSYFRAQFAWFGCALLAFLLFVMQLVFRANLQPPPQLETSAFVPAIPLFLTFMAVWLIRLILHF
jgi:uncharacterized membrane protein